MTEDNPKYSTRFEDQAKGFAVGERNIIYNYFGYREEVKTESVAADDNLPCPYRGLYHFNPNDTEYFFGRDVFVEKLFEATKTRNFIPVLGASGSGKSSVIFAGLLPKLEQEGHWKYTYFRPGEGLDPFHALALALVPLLRANLIGNEKVEETKKTAKSLRNDVNHLSYVFAEIKHSHINKKILIFADQLEEIYTQCSDYKIRNRFLDCLLTSFQSSNSGASSSTVLVTTMRGDFLANALAYRPFADMLQNADIKLGAMSREELTEVIEKPAEKLGVSFEAGLVERILSDVEDEPGNLPLLEFALTKLWEKRTGKQLTHDAYEAIDQVKGALANHADDWYEKLESEEEREQARRIFIQLVRPGEGTEDIRRRANRAELGEENWDLITRKDGLADRRLVVTSRNDTEQKTVEVVHEALIQNWDKLREWMKIDRKFRLWQEDLRVAIRQWENSQKDEGALLRGAPLAEAEGWLQKRSAEINKDKNAVEFIKASLSLRDKEKTNQENQRKRKLEQEIKLRKAAEKEKEFRQKQLEQEIKLRKAAEKEKEFRQKQLKQEKKLRKAAQKETVITLIAAPILTLFLIMTGVNWRADRIETIRNLNRFSEQFLFQNRELDALIESIKAVKKLKRTFGVNYNTRTQVIDTLQQAINFAREFNRLQEHDDPVWSVSFSNNGKLIATASSDDTVKLWNQQGKLVRTLEDPSLDRKTHENMVRSVSFSPNNEFIVTASENAGKNGTVKLWNRDDYTVRPLEIENEDGDIGVKSVSFSPDNKFIVAGIYNGNVQVWNIAGQAYQTLKDPNIDDKEHKDKAHEDSVKSVSFSSDGELIATASDDKTVKLWKKNLNDKYELLDDHPPIVHKDQVWSVSFSSDDSFLATGSNDKTVKLWKKQNGEYKYFSTLGEHEGIGLSHKKGILSVSFSPDGQTLATASNDKTVKLWKKQNGEYKYFSTFYGHDGGVLSVSFSPDGQTLATASDDETVKLWNLNSQHTTNIHSHQKELVSLSFNSNDETFFTGGHDGIVKIWNKEGQLTNIIPKSIDDVQIHKDAVYVYVSPDNRVIVTTDWDDKHYLNLWNAKTFERTNLNNNLNEDICQKNEREIYKYVKKINKGVHCGVISNVSFSSDSQFMITSDWSGHVNLWKRQDNTLNYIFEYFLEDEDSKIVKADDIAINSVSFSPEGNLIATGSKDGTVKLWSKDGELDEVLKDKDLEAHKALVGSISFSSDGQILATASNDKTVKLWKKQNKEYEHFRILEGHQDEVWDVKFSPNDSFLATSSKDGTIKIWKNQAGKYDYFRTLYGHNAAVTSISFSPDGTLASASIDKRVILWKSYQKELDELLYDACKWVHDYLDNNSKVSKKDKKLCDEIGNQ